MLKLETVILCDFRSIEHVEVPLQPRLTVLIGDNASGKTSILDAIAVALSPLVTGVTSLGRNALSPDDFRVLGRTDGDVF